MPTQSATSSRPVATELPRDRFLGFAFAAADLLVESGLDGTIGFAAGAFPRRFGRAGDDYVGNRIFSLIAPGDRATLAMALATVTQNGRIAPLTLRLNDGHGTQASLAAMLMPGSPPRLCFSIGPLPRPLIDVTAPRPGHVDDGPLFLRELESALLDGGARTLGLVELAGWPEARASLIHEDFMNLQQSIAGVLAQDGRIAGELADGRYGILGAPDLAISDVTAQIARLLKDSPASRRTRVIDATLTLSHEGIAAGQATRALRHVLSRFTDGGVTAAKAAGVEDGLAGVIAVAEQRAQALRDTIAGRRFRLAFQPVVGLEDLAVHHYEALLRPIITPGTPAQSTQDFVTFAEVVGLAEALDLAVLDEALTVLHSTEAISIAVNISGLSMQSIAFRDRILQRLADESTIAGRLLVELTETAEIEDMPAAADSIAQLRAAGVPVCLDDFGAGAAAFRYLRDFNVDYIKIDGAFVRAALRSPRERGFVASMVELATTAGARTVAEMIETDEQAILMRELGVQYGQGWLFGRPGVLPGARR